MQIQFKGTNYELTNEMTDLGTRKIEGLKKFLGKREKPALAYVDLGKHTEAHQSGDIWYAECNLDVEGKRFNARAQAATLRTAIDKMTGELKRELQTVKKKKQAEERKEGGRLKNWFRFGRP